MIPKVIPYPSNYMTCESLGEAQKRRAKLDNRKERESRGKMKGFSEEFIAPMWNPPGSK